MEKSLVDSFNIVSGDIIIIVFKMIQCIDFSSFERNCLLTRFGVEVFLGCMYYHLLHVFGNSFYIVSEAIFHI